MNDHSTEVLAGQRGVCGALVDALIDKGIISRQELLERLRGAGGWAERMPAPLDRLDGQTVLLVEGDPAAAHDMQTAMEDAGAEVLVTRNAAEALSRMAQFEFSAAVLDWRPEAREHRTATQWMKEDGVRILFYAAHPPEDAASCGDPILPKPAPAREIVRALAKLAVAGGATIGAA